MGRLTPWRDASGGIIQPNVACLDPSHFIEDMFMGIMNVYVYTYMIYIYIYVYVYVCPRMIVYVCPCSDKI